MATAFVQIRYTISKTILFVQTLDRWMLVLFLQRNYFANADTAQKGRPKYIRHNADI